MVPVEFWIVWIALVMQSPAMTPEYSGYAAHYSPGVMERVSRVRKMPLVDCMMASPFYNIGHVVIVTSLKNGKFKHCRITDVPQPYDRNNLIRRKIYAELDFKSAMYLCDIRYVRQEPPRKCPVDINTYIGYPPTEEQSRRSTATKSYSVQSSKGPMVGLYIAQD